MPEKSPHPTTRARKKCLFSGNRPWVSPFFSGASNERAKHLAQAELVNMAKVKLGGETKEEL